MSIENLVPHTDEVEKDITTALRIIGNSAPPEGMQSRVLRHARLAVASGSNAPKTSMRLPLLVGTAFAVVCVVLFVTSRNGQPLKLRTVEPSAALTVAPPPLIATKSKLAVRHTIPNASLQAHIVWAGSWNGAGTLIIPAPSLPVENQPGDASNAPSTPAPALPLTRQERLLLVAADAQMPKTQLAQLRRPVWPLRDPADDEDFSKFFDSPTPTATDGETE